MTVINPIKGEIIAVKTFFYSTLKSYKQRGLPKRTILHNCIELFLLSSLFCQFRHEPLRNLCDQISKARSMNHINHLLPLWEKGHEEALCLQEVSHNHWYSVKNNATQVIHKNKNKIVMIPQKFPYLQISKRKCYETAAYLTIMVPSMPRCHSWKLESIDTVSG